MQAQSVIASCTGAEFTSRNWRELGQDTGRRSELTWGEILRIGRLPHDETQHHEVDDVAIDALASHRPGVFSDHVEASDFVVPGLLPLVEGNPEIGR